MASRPETIPSDPADTEPAETDPAPDGAATRDPIVESIEETGEPSGGNLA
ncbi:hypothetical protein [Sphingomonas sp. SRS2]|nr:hypothetical protein [Sphingomonas sp. SRS2]